MTLLLSPNGHFFRPANISVLQVELRVEIFLWRESCWVVGRGKLCREVLGKGQREGPQGRLPPPEGLRAGGVRGGGRQRQGLEGPGRLTCWAPYSCSMVPKKDSRGFRSARRKGEWPVTPSCLPPHSGPFHQDTLPQSPSARLPLYLLFSSSVKCSVRILVTTFTLLAVKTWRKEEEAEICPGSRTACLQPPQSRGTKGDPEEGSCQGKGGTCARRRAASHLGFVVIHHFAPLRFPDPEARGVSARQASVSRSLGF